MNWFVKKIADMLGIYDPAEMYQTIEVRRCVTDGIRELSDPFTAFVDFDREKVDETKEQSRG